MTVDPERKFFVVHLQKTAGTTLRDRFRNTFSDEQIYPHKKDGPDILHAIISLSHLRKRWQERGDEIKLVAGHFPLSTTELLGGPFTTLCVLRPPLERTSTSPNTHRCWRTRAEVKIVSLHGNGHHGKFRVMPELHLRKENPTTYNLAIVSQRWCLGRRFVYSTFVHVYYRAGKKVDPRLRVCRLLTPSGRGWRVHAT